jgi:predicted aspartyl protease
MSIFRVPIEAGDRQGRRFERMDALVDTGSTYTWVPRGLLERLGVTPDEDREFILADGRRSRYPLAYLPVRLAGRTAPAAVIFGDEGTEPLLGVVTLETLGLGVDAVNERLIETPGMLK